MYLNSTILLNANSKWATMNKQQIKHWLKVTRIPLTVISRELNISRNTLYTWMKEGSDMRSTNVEKILEVYGDDIAKENLKEGILPNRTTSNLETIDSNYVMGLQKREIDRLQIENQQLRQSQYTVQSKAWDEVEYDFYSDVRITFIPFERIVYSMKGPGMSELAERLEIDEDLMLKDYFSVGKWHKFNNHPVNELIEPKTLKDLQGMSIKMPTIFDSLKTLVGEHYFQQLIVYKHGNNTVNTVCNIKIHWLENPHRAECKTQFISFQ